MYFSFKIFPENTTLNVFYFEVVSGKCIHIPLLSSFPSGK